MAARSAREIRGQAAGSDDDDLNLTSADCEMVLSKEEFDMLQAFHRFVPLPALSSRILRVYCEDDLQVPEASHEDTEEGGSDTRKPSPSDRGLQSDTTQSSKSGNILRHPCRPSNLRKKPHYQINLTSQTPRIQQQQQQQPAPPSSRTPSSSRSSADSERSERPEVQD